MKLSTYAGFMGLISHNGIDGAFRLAAKYGYCGAELIFTKDECESISDDAQAYVTAARENGVSIGCISCYTDIVSENEPYRVDFSGVTTVKRCVDLAKEIGCPLVHHTIVTRLSGTRDNYENVLVPALSAASEITEYAAKLGIDVIYEPQGMLFNGYAGYSKFFDTMCSRYANTGVCLDVGNTLWVDEDCYDLAQKYSDRIKHVHLKDYELDSYDTRYRTAGGRSIREVMIGTGIVDLARIFGILRNSGYGGYISVEDNSSSDYKKIADNAQSIIKELGKSHI